MFQAKKMLFGKFSTQCTPSGFSQFNSPLTALRNSQENKSLITFKAFLLQTYSAKRERERGEVEGYN